jgi:hypothetical protein
MDSFQILCERLLKEARTHTEKAKLREKYQSGEAWPIVFAEMSEVKRDYDRILNPARGKS